MAYYIAPNFVNDSEPPLSAQNINAMAQAAQNGQTLVFKQVQIPVSSWQDNDGSLYPFIASFDNPAITANMTPTVVFSSEDVASANFSPVARTDEGSVYIYANEKPTGTITIPLITLTVGVESND